MGLTEKQKYWRRHVVAVEAFDGTMAEYARQQSLNVKQLYAHREAIQKAEAPKNANFIQVAAEPAMTASQQPVMVALPNGVKLSLPNLDSPELLERLAAL